MKKAVIFYFSQGGNTKKLADRLGGILGKSKIEAILCDIAGNEIPELSQVDLIYFGTPMYYRADPVVWREWFKKLPGLGGKNAFLFTTYGEYLSKMPDKNLRENFAQLVASKGSYIIDAHGMICPDTFYVLQNFGAERGSPTEEDLAGFDRFVNQSLEYSPEAAGSKPRAIIKTGKLHSRSPIYPVAPKIRIRNDLCNRCGNCARVCPMGNIEVKDSVYVGKNCMKCYECENKCPRKAVQPNWRPFEIILGLKPRYAKQ